MIFLDNASTTRPFDEVTALVAKISQELFFNASATYRAGIESYSALNAARETLAALLGCLPEEVYFTSGGTESDNISLFSGYKNRRGCIISSEIEHPAVHNCVLEWKNRGADVRFVRTLPDGHLDEAHFKSLLEGEVSLVSLMQVNNETGVVNDVSKFARLAKAHDPDCVVHCDGVQGFLKSPLDLEDIDLYSMSAHKINGPKGVGALYLKKNLHIKSPVFGGGQERGLRSGTENVPGACGFAKAAELFAARKTEIFSAAERIRETLLSAFEREGLDFRVNGGGRVQENILSVSFGGMKAEILYQLLSDREIFVSRGSACSTKVKTTRIARALNLPKRYAEGTMRFSSGYGNTVEEAETAARAVCEFVKKYAV